jgi:hypothetical protein
VSDQCGRLRDLGEDDEGVVHVAVERVPELVGATRAMAAPVHRDDRMVTRQQRQETLPFGAINEAGMDQEERSAIRRAYAFIGNDGAIG